MTLALALAAALAAPVTLPFAPPTGRPVFYETEQRRTVAGEAQSYRMVNRLDFVAVPGGWRLTITLVDVAATAPADSAALFDAGMRPFIGTPIALRLDADGRPAAPINAAATWAAIVRSLDAVADRLAARNGGESGAVRATRAWFAAFAALDGAARDAKLMETADALIGFDLPALHPGESAPWRAAATDGTVAVGRITLTRATDAVADYDVRASTALPDTAQPPLTEENGFSIDRASGLLVASRTVKRLGAAVLADETVRRIR